jgi:hypothetical protein
MINYTLVEDNADNVAERFVWSAASIYGDRDRI